MKKRNLASYFFILILILLLLVLYFNLKRQKVFFDEQLTPIVSAFDSIIANERFEKEIDLKYVRSLKIFPRRVYEYLYPRRYNEDIVCEKVIRLLSEYGIGIANITVDESSQDISFLLGSEEMILAELICRPDMSTFAGKICLIIDDFGYNLNSVVKSFMELDIPATFAILPGHTYTEKVATLADEGGFEVMVHMPMESKDDFAGEDKFILNQRLTNSEIRQRLKNALLEIPQAKGLNNHQGSSATENRRIMRLVADILREEDKYFVDSKTSANSVAVDQMQQAKVPVAVRTVFIDYEDNQETVRRQLKLLEKEARNIGVVVGIGHPRKKTLTVLGQEIPRLRQEGFDFIFASDVVR